MHSDRRLEAQNMAHEDFRCQSCNLYWKLQLRQIVVRSLVTYRKLQGRLHIPFPLIGHASSPETYSAFLLGLRDLGLLGVARQSFGGLT